MSQKLKLRQSMNRCSIMKIIRSKLNKESVKLVVASSLLAFMAGCSTKVAPLTDAERFERVTQDMVSMFENQQAVTAPITLGEAIARSISYNLDHRLKRMESALAVRKYKFDKTGLLPRIVADAGYSRRSNDPGANSVDIDTGEETLANSTSTERTNEFSDLVFTWNTLDFGLAYYTAKQSSNEVLVAEERRRKTIQNISQDVIDAFWKAWMAQSLQPKIDALLAESSRALDSSRSLVSRGVQNSSDALTLQSSILNTINSLNEMRERVDLGKARLGALLNIRPGTDFKVSPPSTMDVPSRLSSSVDEISQKALLNRPELREEDYRKRVTQLDVKKAVLKMFPQLTFSTGYYRNENEFLVNNDWTEIGADLSWDLLGILNANAEKRFHQASVDVADARRVALSLAVITQVYLGVSRYELARSRYASASELYDIRARLARNDRSSGSRVSGIEELDSRASALAAEMRRNLAFAETQAAFARVINSAGIDPVPASVENEDLGTLSAAFNQRWSDIVKGALLDY